MLPLAARRTNISANFRRRETVSAYHFRQRFSSFQRYTPQISISSLVHQTIATKDSPRYVTNLYCFRSPSDHLTHQKPANNMEQRYGTYEVALLGEIGRHEE